MEFKLVAFIFCWLLAAAYSYPHIFPSMGLDEEIPELSPDETNNLFRYLVLSKYGLDSPDYPVSDQIFSDEETTEMPMMRLYANQKRFFAEGTPKSFDADRKPNHFNGMPMSFDGMPRSFDRMPMSFEGMPRSFDAQGFGSQGRPMRFDGMPRNFDAQGFGSQGRPMQFDEMPMNFDGMPRSFDAQGRPMSFDEIPKDLDGMPMSFDLDGNPINFDANGNPMLFDTNGRLVSFDTSLMPHDSKYHSIDDSKLGNSMHKFRQDIQKFQKDSDIKAKTNNDSNLGHSLHQLREDIHKFQKDSGITTTANPKAKLLLSIDYKPSATTSEPDVLASMPPVISPSKGQKEFVMLRPPTDNHRKIEHMMEEMASDLGMEAPIKVQKRGSESDIKAM